MSDFDMCCGTTCDKNAVAAEIASLKLRNDNLQSMVDANLRNVGRLRKFAFEHGFDPAKEMNEDEFIFALVEQMKQQLNER